MIANFINDDGIWQVRYYYSSLYQSIVMVQNNRINILNMIVLMRNCI